MNSQQRKIVLVVVVVALVVAGFLYRDKLSSILNRNSTKLSGYQAVFLTSGQVYFGKISQTRNDFVVLEDIYYLQVNKQLQPETEAPASSQLSLVKLGNELHGPDDLMHINRDQILFFENLKSSGRVVQAIIEYQKSKETAAVKSPATGETETTDTKPTTTTPKKQ